MHEANMTAHCVRCHVIIVYSFQDSLDTGKIAPKRSSRALTSQRLRSRHCCMAENVPCQQTKKAWSMPPPLPRVSLQISLPPAPLRVCIPLLVVVFIFYKWSLKCPQGGLREQTFGWNKEGGRKRVGKSSAPYSRRVDGAWRLGRLTNVRRRG